MSGDGSTGLAERIRSLAPTLSVGVLSADWLSLGSEVRILESAGVRMIHFDVMDGCFCPLMTLGSPIVKAVKTSMLKDVHLMVRDPLDKLDAFVSAGADIVTVQVEACAHPHRVLQALKGMRNSNDPSRGVIRGLGLNPGTPLEAVDPLLDEVDMVLLLAVNPGWGGQKFIPSTERRVRRLIETIGASGRDVLVCVDGGITRDNAEAVVRMGADIVVTGSAIFDGKAAAENARELLAAVRRRLK